MARLRKELNDRSQWNSSSGRENAAPETAGPVPIANKDNAWTEPRHGVKFTIGSQRAHNLATTTKLPDGS